MYSDFPSTRYQGSKRRILDWIRECLIDIEFDTVLDIFGGTGAVSYLFKTMGKEVTFNDILLCNTTSARALIRNNGVKRLPKGWLERVNSILPYEGVVTKGYDGIFFTDTENKEIDKIAHSIFYNPDTRLVGVQRDIALHALSQALLMKRPFNLFHRANLDVRLKICERNFGNKTTWETPIMDLMSRNIAELTNAVFSNGRRHHVYRRDAMDIGGGYDLVYIDPPYCSERGICADYQDYYSFLDGLCDYGNWEGRIDYTKKNLPLKKQRISFVRNTFEDDLKNLISKHSGSIIVMSYKSPGLPTVDWIADILKTTHKEPITHEKKFKYALNRNNGNCKENLFIAMPKG